MLKVDAQGKLTLAGQNWKISLALAGEWVQVVRLESRRLVYYCTTLIRERRTQPVRDVPGRFVRDVLGLDKKITGEGGTIQVVIRCPVSVRSQSLLAHLDTMTRIDLQPIRHPCSQVVAAPIAAPPNTSHTELIR